MTLQKRYIRPPSAAANGSASQRDAPRSRRPRRTAKVVLPPSQCTWTPPPCARVISCTMNSPSPRLPWSSWSRRAAPRWSGLDISRSTDASMGPLFATSPLSGTRGSHLPLPRPHDHRHQMRSDLLQAAQDQSQSRLRRTERRRHSGRRARLARDVHAVRSGLLRRRNVPARADRQPVRPESVTHVPGMNCDLCARNGPGFRW
jgi:hypothetical protein